MTEGLIPVAPDDLEMEAAITAAKESFRQFLDAFLEPAPGQMSFLVKVAFIKGEEVEHIWVADLNFNRKTPRGVIANEPALRGFRFKQHVKFSPSQITDWMYIENGRLVGGYTIRLLRDRMSPEERKAFDDAAPYTL